MISLCLVAMARQRVRNRGKGRAKGGGQWHAVSAVCMRGRWVIQFTASCIHGHTKDICFFRDCV